MRFFSGKARDFSGDLETGSKYRIPLNFKITGYFPERIISSGRGGEFLQYLKKEFIKPGILHAGAILIFKQKDYEEWMERIEFIKENFSAEVKEITGKLGTKIDINPQSVTIFSEVTLTSIFKREGIKLNSTYDFSEGEFVLILAPFLYRESNETVVEVTTIAGERELHGNIFKGQRDFVLGEEWFYNIWIPQLNIYGIKAPIKFKYSSQEIHLANIQEIGSNFEIYPYGDLKLLIHRKEQKESVIYDITYKRKTDELQISINFRIFEPLREVTLGFPEEEGFIDSTPSIYRDFSLRTEDISLSYILFPRPIGPVRSYEVYMGPDGELLDTKLIICLKIHVEGNKIKINKKEFSFLEKIGINFQVGALNYRVSTDNFCEKLWVRNNRYFLFEVEIPQKRGFYFRGNLALIGRDPRNSIKLPSGEAGDFRNIHTSRFHAIMVREDGKLWVVNISAHFDVYIFRNEEVITLCPSPGGKEIYSRVPGINDRAGTLEEVLKELSVKGVKPSFISLNSGDKILVGNSVFSITG